MVQIWGSKQLLDSPIDALAVDPYVMCPGSPLCQDLVRHSEATEITH